MSTRRVLTLGAACLVVVGVGWYALRPRPPVASQPTSLPLNGSSSRSALMPLPTEAAPLVAPGEMLGDPADQGGPGAHPPGQAVGLLETLVAALRAANEESPETFHDEAVGLLVKFSEDNKAAFRPALVLAATNLLDGGSLGDRVQGALLALLGGWGETEAVLSRCSGQEEVLRSALLGMGWQMGQPAQAAALALDPRDYLRWQMRGNAQVLPVVLERIPKGDQAARLEQLALSFSENMKQLLTRDLSILALGTGVDADPDILSLFSSLLLNTSPPMLQARPPICYVLSHARSESAQELLLHFIEDPSYGSQGKTLAAWFVSRYSEMKLDVDLLSSPLFDPDATVEDRMKATDSLLYRPRDGASAEETAQLEEVFALSLLQEQNTTVRLAGVVGLAMADGGWVRLSTLNHVLRTDTLSTSRGWAANGLGRVAESLRPDARLMLFEAQDTEQDDGVLGDIEKALAVLEP